MKTVQDYLDLGLVFVSGDKICRVTSDSSSGEVDIFDRAICAKKYSKGAVKVGADCYARARWTPSSFAWRNNDGVKPEYKGRIEVVTEGGAIVKDAVDNLQWHTSFSLFSRVVKWRPVVLQSYDEKDNKDESFKLPIGIDSPELRYAFKSLKEHLENKPPFWNKSMSDLSCPCVVVNIEASKPAASPKEDKPMKPVYTAGMHSKGELPPVGSDFNIEGWSDGNCTMTAIGRDNILFIYNKIEYVREIKNTGTKPIPKTIKVNGFDVPTPMSEAPEGGSEYFVIDILSDDLVSSIEWEGDFKDNQWLSRGIAHSTESAAIAHAKAMLGINPNPTRSGDGYDRNVLGQNNEGDEI